MANQYNDSSIDQLVGAERIRRRPASMLGDNGLDGARHGFTEIYGNALDEASSGYGNQLDVVYYENGAMSIRDYGRGVPLGWNEDKNNFNWHIIYNELYGGGKYDNGQWYLRSLDTWSDWKDTDVDLLKSIQSNYGVDLSEVPEDGVERTIEDLRVRHENGKFYLKVNNASWGMASWEFLNKRLNYLASVGLNGLGAASTQYTSEFFTVKSYRNGVCTEMNFRRGIPVINGEEVNVFIQSVDMKELEPKVYDTDEPDGTFIYWKPDSEVFTNVDIGSDWLFETCKDIAHVAGIKLNFEDRVSGKTEVIEAGNLQTLLGSKYSNILQIDDTTEEPIVFETNKFSHGSIRVEGKPYVWVCKADITIGLVSKECNNYCYHNSVKMKSGAQYDGIYYALSKFFSEISNSKGVKITEDDYKEYFGVCVSSYSNYASFRNQTKDAVQDVFISDLVFDAIYEKLKMEYGKGNKALMEVIDSVVESANTRIAEKALRKIANEAKKVTRLKEPEKFVTCKAYEKKQFDRTELWITEGDSAKGSVKSARDKDFQAIFPIRGKGLNVLKAGIDKILANAEIKNLFALLGTGFDINLKDHNPFDITKLKFDKIIFATDADEDGYQIRVLLYLVFYRLAPQLLREGHVYIAETPRFEVVMTDGTTEYALDDRGRDEILSANAGRVKKVNRFKGLGEVDADVLRKTTVAPESRNLIRLSCDLQNETEREFIDALFGADKFKQRKAILTSVFGGNVANMIDENALLIEQIENSDIEEETEYEVV